MKPALLTLLLGFTALSQSSLAQSDIPLRIEQAGFTPDGKFELHITGEPNTCFLLESSSDCDYFDGLGEPSPVSGTQVRFYWCDDTGKCVATDSFPNAASRFYRLHMFVMTIYAQAEQRIR